jgi:Cu-Zn family superoxide dismutase
MRFHPGRCATEEIMRIRELMGTAAAAAVLLAVFAIPASAELANSQLKDGSGKAIGDADLVQAQGGVLIKLRLKGAPAGERAFHIHAVGKCDPPFESAGPHFNPGNHKHGMLSGPGHAGDLPNLHVPQSGELSVEVLAAAVTLEKGKPNSLFDNDGSSLVIHAQADDYKSDPSGNAGGRIACGVIQPSGAGATVGSSGGSAPANAPARR